MGIHRPPVNVCKPERQTRNLHVVHRHRVVGQSVHVNDRVVQRHGAQDPPDNVPRPVWADGVVARAQGTPQEQLTVRLDVCGIPGNCGGDRTS